MTAAAAPAGAVSVSEALRARQVVGRYLRPTPLAGYTALSRALGAQVWVKHENHNPAGSFKLRGGLNLVSRVLAQGVKGVMTFSTGNHGLSIATAGHWLGLPAAIVLPCNANPVKKQAIRDCGAELIEVGENFDAAARATGELCQERGYYLAHPCNDALLINGVATEFLEILEAQPDVEVVIVPLGGGSEAAAAVAMLRALKPDVEVIAVQAGQSPAAYNSWQAGRICEAPNHTFAGGVATGQAYPVPFGIYKDGLADFVLLSEDEIYEGIALAGHYTHNLVEGAGALPLMAAFKLRSRLQGKKVVLQMSGCNASPEEIRQALQRPAFQDGFAG